MQDFIIPQEAALLRCCVEFSDKCWGTLTKKCVLFMMCQITVLRVDLSVCIQPLIWLNLNSIKCLLVGTWLAYYIFHFNEKHSDANTVCLDWVQMPLSWLMKAFDHTSTNWNLKKEEAIWTGICNAVNYLVPIIHKSLWSEGLWGFSGGVVMVVLPVSIYAVNNYMCKLTLIARVVRNMKELHVWTSQE